MRASAGVVGVRRRAGPCVAYAAALSVLFVVVVHGFWPGPVSSQPGSLSPAFASGWAAAVVARWSEQLELGLLWRLGVHTRSLVAGCVIAIPLVVFAGALRSCREPAMRIALLALSLASARLVWFGVETPALWSAYGWRHLVTESIIAIVASAVVFAPSVSRELRTRAPWVGAAVALGAIGLCLLAVTEITGASDDANANYGPWPAIPVVGLLLVVPVVAGIHVAGGAGSWFARGFPGVRGSVLGAAFAAAFGAAVCAVMFSTSGAVQLGLFGIASAFCALTPAPDTHAGRRRAVCGLFLLGVVLVSERAAVAVHTSALDAASRGVIPALDAYRDQTGRYPEHLSALVPAYLDHVPIPRLGALARNDGEYRYTNFGESFALEFASVLWKLCTYSPAYPGRGAELEASWSCERRPAAFW